MDRISLISSDPSANLLCCRTLFYFLFWLEKDRARNFIIFNLFILLIIMEESEIQNYFREILKNDDDLSIGIAAIKVLLEMVKRTDCKFVFLFERLFSS